MIKLFEPDVDRAMWNRDRYEISAGSFKAVIKLTARGIFSGSIYRFDNMIHKSSALNLNDLIRNLNNSIREAINAANDFRPKAMLGGVDRTKTEPIEKGICPRTPVDVNARTKSKDMGNTQAKVTFDWGQNQ